MRIYKSLLKDYLINMHNISMGKFCNICLDNESESVDYFQLRCGHVFHRDCIKQWYFKSDINNETCPICRRKLYGNIFNAWKREKQYLKKQELHEMYFMMIFDTFETLTQSREYHCVDDPTYFLMSNLKFIEYLNEHTNVNNFEFMYNNPLSMICYEQFIDMDFLVYSDILYTDVLVSKSHYGVIASISPNFKLKDYYIV